MPRLKLFFLILWGWLISSLPASSQVALDSSRSEIPDTSFAHVQRDSLYYARLDSLRRVHPIPLAGAIEPYGDSTSDILSSEIPWIEYRYIGDLLWTRPGMYIGDMGSTGQDYQMTIGGIDTRGIGFLVGGRSENDPITGTYDLMLYPVDDIERIEFITGPRAFFYGMNATGGAINIVPKSYYTNKPYSRLRYSQGADDYAQTDAIFSQNIFSKFNFTFGLSRHTLGSDNLADGYRGHYDNSNYDAWTFRTKLRYNLSNSFDILFTHMYYQAWTGLNGGVNISTTDPADIYNPFGATVYNTDAYEKRFNHQLDLTAVMHPGGDTTQVTTLTAYYSNQLRQYRDEENRPLSNGIYLASDNRSSTRGAVLRHVWDAGENNLNASLEAEEIRVESSPEVGGHVLNKFSASLKDELHLFEPLSVAVFGRTDDYDSKFVNGSGADVNFAPVQGISLYAGASVADRAPTLQELYWTSDTLPRPTPRNLVDERHTVLEAGLHFSFLDFLSGAITYTRRKVLHQIFFDTTVIENSTGDHTLLQVSQDGPKTYNTLAVQMSASYKYFYAEGNATYLKEPTYYHGAEPLTLLPDVYLAGSVYYRNILANGHLDLKVGIRGRFVSRQTGMAPLLPSDIFVPYTLASFGPSGAMDFLVIGRIGDAYIHLVWENVTGVEYMLTPVYPMYGSNVRFGVSWEFLD
jgi:outer membrane receptor protein involved in Fe transport